MRKNTFIKIFTILMVLALTATTVLASSPYFIDSRPEFLATIYGTTGGAVGKQRTCESATSKEEAESHDFCWWRDTTAQNALADYSEDEFTGSVTQYTPVYGPTILVYNPINGGPNVTAIIGPSEMLIVGAGGSRAYANNAKLAFQNAYTGFMGKHLVGIVFPDATPESSWGVTYWRSLFRTNPPAPIIVSAEYDHARAERDAVGKELTARQAMAYGNVITQTGQLWGWGENGFLGLGTMKAYNPNLPNFIPPGNNDIFISQPTNYTVNGHPITLWPTYDGNGTLRVYLGRDLGYGPWCDSGSPTRPGVDLCYGDEGWEVYAAISGDAGSKFLSEAGSITQPYLPVRDQIASLDQIAHMVNSYYVTETAESATTYIIPSHGQPYACQPNDFNPGNCDFLAAKRDALNYIKDETLKYINYGYALDDIVTMVILPEYLADSPYTKEFAATVPMLVRSIYHEYLGWFTEDPFELTPMNTTEQAARLVDMAGGVDTALVIARKAATEHTLSGANWAFYLTRAIRMVAPSAEADGIYIAALQKLAWSAKSAQVRNYYLSLIWEAKNPDASQFMNDFYTWEQLEQMEPMELEQSELEQSEVEPSEP